jgi:hypothetical protein
MLLEMDMKVLQGAGAKLEWDGLQNARDFGGQTAVSFLRRGRGCATPGLLALAKTDFEGSERLDLDAIEGSGCDSHRRDE